MPIVSIITVNFNNLKGLKSTIESVLEQTFSDYEFIIIDGGSTDGSVECIKNYSKHITYWVSEPDKGIYNAMNKGLNKAKGNFVYFLNSGDIIYKTALQTIFSNPAQMLKYDVLYGDIVNNEPKLLVRCKAPQTILFDLPFCHQAVLSSLNLHHIYPFDEDYRIAADYDFFLKVYLDKHIFYQADIIFGEIETTGISNTAFFKTMSEYVKVLWRNSKGVSRIYNPLNYIWHKKKFIIYLLLNKFIGPLTYKKIGNSFKKANIK